MFHRAMGFAPHSEYQRLASAHALRWAIGEGTVRRGGACQGVRRRHHQCERDVAAAARGVGLGKDGLRLESELEGRYWPPPATSQGPRPPTASSHIAATVNCFSFLLFDPSLTPDRSQPLPHRHACFDGGLL